MPSRLAPAALVLTALLPVLPAAPAAAELPAPPASGPVAVVAALRDGDSLEFEVRQARSAAAAVALADRWEDEPGVVAASVDVPVRALEVVPAAVSATPTPVADPRRPAQWALDRLQAETVWQGGTGSGVVVAVLDTGVDARHRDLAGQVLPPIDLVEPASTRTVSIDPNGHGTHVAGIVAAVAGNGYGIAGFAPGVQVLPVRVLDRSGSGTLAAVASGMTRAVDAGADVLNLSLGAAGGADVLDAAVRHATDAGVVVVAASGNSGLDGPPEWPAASPGALGVAAVRSDLERSLFSTSGSHVDLAAPGEDVLSTTPRTTASPSGTFSSYSGTSMASPYAAAAAALLVQSGCAGPYVGLRLRSTARDLGPSGRDELYGDGLVDVLAARAGARSAGPVPPLGTSGLATPCTAAPAAAPTSAPSPPSVPAPGQPAPQPAPAPQPVPQPVSPPQPPALRPPAPQPAPQPPAPQPPVQLPAAPAPALPPAAQPAAPAAPDRTVTALRPVMSVRSSTSASVVLAGRPVTVTGRALSDGRGTPGLPVALEQSAGGAWSVLRTSTSGADGLVEWRLTPDRTRAYRLRVGGASPSATTPATEVGVRQAVSATLRRTGSAASATGRVAPAGVAQVALERRTATGWVAVVRGRTAADGRFRLAAPAPRGAVLRVTAAARPGLLPGASGP